VKRIITKINKARLFSIMMLTLLLAATFTIQAQDAEKFHRFWPDNLYAVEFPSDKVGYVAGYSGSLFKTEDGGESWSGIYMGVTELIRKMSFINETTGWAVGHRGSILHTSDAGLTWAVQHSDKGNYLRDISFADENNGWVVGHNSTIWHTADGGKSWAKQDMQGFRGRDAPSLHSVIAKDANTAILVGEFGTVAHTEDAGVTWLVSYNKSGDTLLSIVNQGTGAIAVGLDGGVFRINIATDEQREEVKLILDAEFAKVVKKAMKKAKRKRREYVPIERVVLPETAIDYAITKIDSGTKEHLYELATTNDGSAIAVGASTIMKISPESVTQLTAGKDFPLPYVWVGGVDVTPSGDLWAAGLRGMIIKGSVAEMSYDKKVNIAEPGKVELISNRWGE